MVPICAATKGLQHSGALHTGTRHSRSDTIWNSLFCSPIHTASGLQGLFILLFTQEKVNKGEPGQTTAVPTTLSEEAETAVVLLEVSPNSLV